MLLVGTKKNMMKIDNFILALHKWPFKYCSVPPSKPIKAITNVLKAKNGASSTRTHGLWIVYSWYPEPYIPSTLPFRLGTFCPLIPIAPDVSLYYKGMQMYWSMCWFAKFNSTKDVHMLHLPNFLSPKFSSIRYSIYVYVYVIINALQYYRIVKSWRLKS